MNVVIIYIRISASSHCHIPFYAIPLIKPANTLDTCLIQFSVYL